MSKAEHFDIFISYRRDGGYDTAQLLYDRLTQMRYRVSFDLETLRGGKFNAQLYQRIEQCTDVLVIMSKDSLSLRNNPDDDWFRLEIAHALKHKKNIVPVFLRDFKFPHKGELPPDIADIVDYQGVTASPEHFAVYLTGILSVVDEKSLSKFKQKMVPMLEMLPELKRPWQRNEAEIERHLDTIAERIKEQLDELSSLIGNKHLERRSIERRIDEARKRAQEALH